MPLRIDGDPRLPGCLVITGSPIPCMDNRNAIDRYEAIALHHLRGDVSWMRCDFVPDDTDQRIIGTDEVLSAPEDNPTSGIQPNQTHAWH